MHKVQCRAGPLRRGDRLLDRGDAKGAGMHEHRHLTLGGHAEHCLDLAGFRRRRVVDPKANAQGTLVESTADRLAHRFQFRRACRPVSSRRSHAQAGDHGPPGHPVSYLKAGMKRGEPCRDVAHGGSVVERCLAGPRRIPRGHRIHAHLHVERGGDAVAGLDLHVAGGLTVRVEVDEAGGHHLTGNRHHLGTGERGCGDRHDLATSDANVPDSIQSRGRVHHPPTCEHQVVARSG